MEQQIKCLLERFEQIILTHIKKECPEFAETYDEKILYEPSRSVYLRNNTIKLIFNEIYSSMRDYVGAETHGFSLDKINTYTDSIEAKTYTSCELSVGKGLYILAQGESNSIDKLRSVIEVIEKFCNGVLKVFFFIRNKNRNRIGTRRKRDWFNSGLRRGKVWSLCWPYSNLVYIFSDQNHSHYVRS